MNKAVAKGFSVGVIAPIITLVVYIAFVLEVELEIAFAEFERSLIRERQREGIAIAKKKGLYKGRKPSLSKEQIEELKIRVQNGDRKSDIAKDLKISRETLYQYLRKK